MDLNAVQKKMQAASEHFKRELSGVRTGRAHPALIQDLRADYYGTPTPLQQLGSITTPEANTIIVQVWDANAVTAVAKAIQESDLGLNPSVDAQLVRVTLPSLTEERREELVKHIGKLAEAARVSIKGIRADALKSLRAQQKEGGMSEDVVEQEEKKLQKIVDDANAHIEELTKQKETEVRTI